MIRKSQLSLDAVHEVFESAFLDVEFTPDRSMLLVNGIGNFPVLVSVNNDNHRISLAVCQNDQIANEQRWQNGAAQVNSNLEVLSKFWIERWESNIAILAVVHLLADPSVNKRQIVVAARTLANEYDAFAQWVLSQG